jgi:hypothetical protein
VLETAIVSDFDRLNAHGLTLFVNAKGQPLT